MSQKKVSFLAHAKVSKPVKVSFVVHGGKKVSFTATKAVMRPVKVTFYVKKHSK